MSYRRIVADLEQEYQMKRRKAEFIARSEYDGLLSACPDLNEADTLLRRQMRLFGFGQSTQEELDAAKENVSRLLKLHGIDVARITPRFTCEKCQDTGKVAGKHCSCFMQEVFTRLYGQAQLDPQAMDQTFENFDLSVFPEEVPQGYSMTQRAFMEKVCREATQYAADFPHNQKNNLLLLGPAGVGKTYLANCIAAEVLKKGYSVLSTSAFALFDRLSDRLSGKETDMTHIKEADLLLLDDLGMEPTLNNFTLEYLFEILNMRLKHQKHTIITSNLDPNELKARYTERISSRLFDRLHAMAIYLPGKDLRLLNR